MSGSDATFNKPSGIAVSNDGDRIYVSDQDNHNIRLVQYSGGGSRSLAASYTISHIAGDDTATPSSGSTDGSGTSARFNQPDQIVLVTDALGTETLFVVDRGNTKVRRIESPASATTSYTSTVAGTGAAGSTDNAAGSIAQLNVPYGITALTGEGGQLALFVTDRHRLRLITYSPGAEPRQAGSYFVTTLAGAYNVSGQDDGDGTVADFNTSFGGGLCVVAAPGPSATLYVADCDNHAIRKVQVSSVALQSGATGGTATEAVRLVNWDAELPNNNGTAAWAKNLSPASDGQGYAADAQFYVPKEVSGFSFTAYVETESTPGWSGIRFPPGWRMCVPPIAAGAEAQGLPPPIRWIWRRGC